jgi:hypothetical protein
MNFERETTMLRDDFQCCGRARLDSLGLVCQVGLAIRMAEITASNFNHTMYIFGLHHNYHTMLTFKRIA